jgi:succinate dehydrogenase/fumarate reductase flavoprotein subunit
MYSHDVLIVGSGLAGLRATMESVGHLDVAVVTKAYPSRSAHFRTDPPARDDANWPQHALAFRSTDDDHALRSKPVTATRFEPEERNYQ